MLVGGMTPFRLLLVLHVIAGTLAVAAGLAALIAPKPVAARAPFHRRAGSIFNALMSVVLGTAIAMTVLRFQPYFAGLTAAATIGVFSGNRVLRRKRPDLDPRQRAAPLDWIVTLILFAVGAFLFALLLRGQVTQNVPVVRALAYGTMGYTAYDLYRFTFPRAFPFTPRLWLYEHIVKMIGGYFGAVAAFSGSVLTLFPPPWRQLWATLAGQILSVILVAYYVRTGRRAEHP